MGDNVLQYLQDSLVDQYRVLDLNIAQLADPSATEALHQTRIAMRRLRSLLRPWREQGDWFSGVDSLSAELGRETGPLRDRQVLVQELETRGAHYQAVFRQEAMQTSCALLAGDLRYRLLQLAIINLEQRLAVGSDDYRLESDTLDNYAYKLTRKLRKTLGKKNPDLHEVRKEIKKLRYLYQAYSEYLLPSSELTKALKRAQNELGEWHDNLQWLMISERETDLYCCRDHWQTQIDQRAERAWKRLKKLRKLLRSPKG